MWTCRTTRAGDDPLSDERYSTDADFDVVDRLARVAAERGAPPAQVALAWLRSMKAIIQSKLSSGSALHWKPWEASSIANPCMVQRMVR